MPQQRQQKVRKLPVTSTHVPAMTQTNAIEEERLLTRLANFWHLARSGSPGFDWLNARTAHSSDRVWARLSASVGWTSSSSDRELYGAWVQAVQNDQWTPELWDEGDTAAFARTPEQKSSARKRGLQSPQSNGSTERRAQSQSISAHSASGSSALALSEDCADCIATGSSATGKSGLPPPPAPAAGAAPRAAQAAGSEDRDKLMPPAQ